MNADSFVQNFGHLADAPGGMQTLREMLLKLAVRGKLAEQDSNDEPASLFIEDIYKKKDELVSEKLIPKQSRLPKIDEEHLPFRPPAGWKWVRLETVCEIITKGSSPKWQGVNYVQNGEGVLFITSENVGNYVLRKMEQPKFVESKFNEMEPRSILQRDDILVTLVGASIGRSAIYDRDDAANINQAVGIVRLVRGTTQLNRRFLLHYLNSPVCLAIMFENQVETARANISLTNVKQFLVPVPPLSEQERIVAKVDELMALCDELEARQQERRTVHVHLNNATLDRVTSAESDTDFGTAWTRVRSNFDLLYSVPENVNGLREAILQLAVQGKLVEQDSDDEPVTELLHRIEQERHAAAADDRRAKSVEPIESGEKMRSLPVGWAWERLGHLALFIDYRGKTPPKTDSGIRLITAKNVRFGFVADEPAEYVSGKTYKEWMTRGFPRRGDVLFTTEAPLGNVAVLNTDETIALAQRVINFRLYAELSPQFLTYCLMSPLMQEALIDRATGMTAKGIKSSKLKLVPVPVPPVAEQRRIVEKIDEMMCLCDELESNLMQQQTDADRLTSAMVAAILDGAAA